MLVIIPRHLAVIEQVALVLGALLYGVDHAIEEQGQMGPSRIRQGCYYEYRLAVAYCFIGTVMLVRSDVRDRLADSMQELHLKTTIARAMGLLSTEVTKCSRRWMAN